MKLLRAVERRSRSVWLDLVPLKNLDDLIIGAFGSKNRLVERDAEKIDRSIKPTRKSSIS